MVRVKRSWTYLTKIPFPPYQDFTFSICWRYQKNQQNGECKLLTRNDAHKQFCGVRAALRICHRAIHLRVARNSPLETYQTITKQTRLLSNKHVEFALKQAARNVYHLKTKKDLQKFTCHSLRVGACVMLHIAGFSDTDIKFELRWRSDSFRDYLRNVLCMAAAKPTALCNFDPDTVEF